MFITIAQLIFQLKNRLFTIHNDKKEGNDVKTEQADQQIRDQKLDNLDQKVDDIRESLISNKSRFNNILESEEAKDGNEKILVSKDKLEEVDNKFNEIYKNGNSINEQLDAMPKKEIGENSSDMMNFSSKLEEIIRDLFKGAKNLFSDFKLDAYYEYLDSLTQIQEGSFLHILVFLYIFLSLIHILLIYLSNEIIKYFNLEEKYPKLGIIFRLRAKYQRYYLLFNIFVLLLLCLLAIGFNLLILLYS